MNYIFLLINILSAFLFMFVFWKRLKGDYADDQIFGTSLSILVLTAIFAISTQLIFGNYWFWPAVVGSMIGLTYSNRKFAIGFFESLEATFIAYLPWLSLIYLYDFAVNQNVISVSLFAVTILTAVIFQIIDRNYRRITWYKSGKVGIAGLVSIVLFFATRLVIGLAADTALSFFGIYDIILSTIVIILGLIAIYKLAKQKNK